jgi:tRNA nucleotidyltransferase (CCA-adding enzyme)
MRALRFAAVLSFSIHKDTSDAMIFHRGRLQNIAAERKAMELNKLILGSNLTTLLAEHLPVLLEVIPELGHSVGFEQNNPYHCYDVLTHIFKSVEAAPKEELEIRLTMLFHDIGKPHRYSESEGVGHFYGHAGVSEDIARDVLNRLKYDNATISEVTQLVKHHDTDIPKKQAKRWLNKLGEESLLRLIEVKRADTLAQAGAVHGTKMMALNELTQAVRIAVEQEQCFSLKDLAINGRDLIALGIEGKQIGITLNALLGRVIDDELVNEKEVLLAAVADV